MPRLGRTGLRVSRTAFGVLPLQRTERREATRILRRAYDAGITFYDTASAYTDSESKIGAALSDVRDRVVIATKTGATTRERVMQDVDMTGVSDAVKQKLGFFTQVPASYDEYYAPPEKRKYKQPVE